MYTLRPTRRALGARRFLELAAAGRPFTAEDYAARTPDWAVFRHPSALPGDGGFDPAERRFRKHAPAAAQ